eukprot:TRINITY_DN5709_c0_g1_i4.p1 TRINITY_DN5709_c0_g1~~TRINITY_DN5709_c0_g1_i4.p1  ORF type:complete len:570 (-),score=87.26 TRINITY_DN5709_c0_g1_i4:217-1926(-)
MAKEKSLIVHPFVDVSTIPPLVFVRILTDTYSLGKGKLVIKYHLLHQQVTTALAMTPSPGPATYVACCLSFLALHTSQDTEALSHLLISAYHGLNKEKIPFADFSEAQTLISRLIWSVITKRTVLQERILVKLATVFDIQVIDLCKHKRTSSVDDMCEVQYIKKLIERYILQLIESRLYTSAVALLRHFSLQHSAPKEFIASMLNDNRLDAATEFAKYIGMDMIRFLVKQGMEMSLFKFAYRIVKKFNLQAEFPEAYYLYMESSLRKLVDKGCWDIAESIAVEDHKLLEYLVTLAVEAGEVEMVEELCDHHNLPKVAVSVVEQKPHTQYLHLYELISEEDVHWVDTAGALVNASKHFCSVNIAAIDCEWKPDAMGTKNKVSILQIASKTKVYIIDLVKLYKEERSVLEKCLKEFFQCSEILKIGYALHNDMGRLLHSYGDIACFQCCMPVLDLQRLCNSSLGGLSGLSKLIVGKYLNKATRMSNWEQRPLTTKQLHYAALDAAVLIPIYSSIIHNPSVIGKKESDLSYRDTVVIHDKVEYLSTSSLNEFSKCMNASLEKGLIAQEHTHL